MDPSVLQLSRVLYSEKLAEAANERGFRKVTTTKPSLPERVLPRLGDALISIGQRLKARSQSGSTRIESLRSF